LLVGPAGPATVAALRDRFRLVLIDEFQDTDQVQWDIFRRVFLVGNPAPAGPGPSTGGGRPDAVVLVGDPKQSIYRFRSAELSAYLEACDYARAHGGRIVSLATNWRSDAPLIEALGQLFAGCTFGDERVEFERVEAAPGHERGALAGVDEVALQIRCLPDDLKVPEVRAIAVPDLVAEVVRLLNAASLPGADPPRPLRASDIGVLVRSNADANTIAAALGAAGVPAARSASDSVLDSPAAAQWRTLLTALERPASASRTRAAALTWFVGLSAAELAALDLGRALRVGRVGDERIAKVSLVGIGMRTHAGIASKMFRTLAEEGINIQMISTSEIKISVVVDEKYLELAVRVLHKAFELDQAAA
jgi:exodeoxyribonuclease V beta subunit